MRAQKVRPQIIARSDRIATAPMFRDAYARRRCLLPVDNFFEWDASIQPNQPYGVGPMGAHLRRRHLRGQ
jgi:putative SOS response-associated peptidase YedK